MAVTFNTDRLQGLNGVTINGVYARIQAVGVKKFDAFGPYTFDSDGNETDTFDTDSPSYSATHWECSYEVVLHGSAAIRNAKGESPAWGNRLRSNEIERFSCTYDPTSNSNPYAQAYADLKTKLAAGGSPIASSIADA